MEVVFVGQENYGCPLIRCNITNLFLRRHFANSDVSLLKSVFDNALVTKVQNKCEQNIPRAKQCTFKYSVLEVLVENNYNCHTTSNVGIL